MKRMRSLLLLLLVAFSLQAHETKPLVLVHAFFEPFIWTESDKSRGLYVDVLHEVATKRMGVEVQFQEMPWRRAQLHVRSGNADGFITVITQERLQYTVANSVPIAQTDVGLYTYIEHPRLAQMRNIQRIEQLRGYQLLTYLGNSWAAENLADMSVDIGGDSIAKVLQKLAEKRGDLFVHGVEITEFQIRRLNLQERVIRVGNTSLGKVDYHLMLGQHSAFRSRMAEFDQHMRTLYTDGTFQAIWKKYQ